MSRRPANVAVNKVVTTLGKTTNFCGNLSFSSSLKIDGKFTGRIESEGYLYVEKGAKVEADIKAKRVVIGGRVVGNVTASEQVEMLESGKLRGNLRTPRLKIADGVEFEGQCDMLRSADSIDIFSASVEKIKKTVHSV